MMAKLSSIERQKKYQAKLRVEKKLKKNEEMFIKKFQKKQEQIELLYGKLTEEALEKTRLKYERKMELRLKREKSKFREKQENKKRVIKGKAPKIKDSKEKRKQKAYEAIQKYAKLSRCDDYGMVTQIDTGHRVMWNKCQGGHIWPKKNYPQLAFKLLNIWPISKMCNKRQADNIGDRIDKTPMTDKEKKRLRDMAENKEEKNKLMDSVYYIDIYNKYNQLNEDILKRLLEFKNKQS